MPTRFDPWRELDRLADELWGARVRPSVPMDVYRKGDEFVVHFDLPGIDPDSIDLSVERDVLTVKAERSQSVVRESLLEIRPCLFAPLAPNSSVE